MFLLEYPNLLFFLAMIRVQKFHDMSDADSEYNPRLQDEAFDYDTSDPEGYLFE